MDIYSQYLQVLVTDLLRVDRARFWFGFAFSLGFCFGA
jgi:hypothetical protein